MKASLCEGKKAARGSKAHGPRAMESGERWGSGSEGCTALDPALAELSGAVQLDVPEVSELIGGKAALRPPFRPLMVEKVGLG